MDLFQRFSRVTSQLADRSSDALRQRMELAWELLAHGNIQAAVQEFQQLTQEYASYAPAWYGLGRSQFLALQTYTNPHDEDAQKAGLHAKQSLQQAVTLAPQYSEAWYQWGQLHEHQQHFTEALTAYHSAWQHNPPNDLRLLIAQHLGNTHIALQQPEHAIRWFRQALSYQPQDVSLWHQLAHALEIKEELNEARAAWTKATELAPKDPIAWYRLGHLLELMHQLPDSTAAYQNAWAQTPTPLVSMALARVALQGQQPKQALEYLRQTTHALRSSTPAALPLPEAGALARLHAQALEADGQLAQALEVYQQVEAYSHPEILLERLHFAVYNGFLAEALVWSQDPRLSEQPEAKLIQSLNPRLSWEQARALLQPYLPPSFSKYPADKNQTFEEIPLFSKTQRLALWCMAHAAQQHKQPLLFFKALQWLWMFDFNDARPLKKLYSSFAPQVSPPTSFWTWLSHVQDTLQHLPKGDPWQKLCQRAKQEEQAPLRVVILGEFNVGKSTLVNAWVEEDLLPTGITPTTALVTVLRYGTEATCRVRFRDGTSLALSWQRRTELLQTLSEREAARIDCVELTLPNPQLQRIELIDTPGLNAWTTWHEDITRSWFTRADVVLWLLSADQAGKASEQQAIDALQQAHPALVVGLLNKADRFRLEDSSSSSTTDSANPVIQKLLMHLRDQIGGMGSLFYRILPISGRDARIGQKNNEEKLVARSQVPLLKQWVLTEWVPQTLALKEKRLRAQARQWLQEAIDHTRSLAPTKPTESAPFSVTAETHLLLGLARKAWLTDMTHAYEQLARDVLALPLPSRSFLQDAAFSSADRDFLAQRLRTLWNELCAHSCTFLETQLQERLSPLMAFVPSLPSESLRALAREFVGFLEGFLAGGLLDQLCQRTLPGTDRTESAFTRALERMLPTSLENIQQRWVDPLRILLESHLSRMYQRARAQHVEQSWPYHLYEATLTQPLQTLQQALSSS